MKRFAIRLVFMLVAAAFMMSCSHFRKIEKSEDWRVKYEAGVTYYNKKDYYRSAVLFEQIQQVVRGLPEGEKIEFYLAYCQYNEKTYLLASNQFKTFFETYGRSPLRIEAQFMYAYSLYISSPDYSYDQQSSVEAMQAMQNFINQHPESTFTERAAEVITKSEDKLELKGYVAAKQYLKLGYYQAAVICFDNFKKHFPDSKYLEELAYLKVTAQYQWAEKSYNFKQVERYKAVTDYYKQLIDNFPTSTYNALAEKFYSDSVLKLSKLKPTKNS